MKVNGTFKIELLPQQDDIPAGRMLIEKDYSGGLEGRGTGQMISMRTEGGESVYSAIETFEGGLNGMKGAFSLFHVGRMSQAGQNLDIKIVEGSGSGDFENIRGTMAIHQVDGIHHYELELEL